MTGLDENLMELQNKSDGFNTLKLVYIIYSSNRKTIYFLVCHTTFSTYVNTSIKWENPIMQYFSSYVSHTYSNERSFEYKLKIISIK